MRVLAIDPGRTTGWCYCVQVDGGPLEVVECGISVDYTIPEEAKGILAEGVVDLVVIEKPPEHGNDSKLLTLYGKLMQVAEMLAYDGELRTPMPGHWKPWAKKINPKKPEIVKTKPVHVWDAYRMGAFALMCYNKDHNA